MISEYFIDGICERRVVIAEYAENLRSSNRPLILYGAGIWASQQYRKLKEFGINFDVVAIDDQYLPRADFFGHQVISIKKAVREYPMANVWVGLNSDRISFETIEKKLRSIGPLSEIYACDCAFFDQFEKHNFSFNKVSADAQTFDWLYQRLADDKSKETMLSYFNQRISGKYQYVKDLFDPQHYFSKDVITLSPNDVFVDCGAFTGDTIESLLGICKPRFIYAFEPDSDNFNTLLNKFKNDVSVMCLKKGAFRNRTTLHFQGGAADASKVCDCGKISIQTETIDNLADLSVSAFWPTFIKMDIEGSELEALKGAERTIKKMHPKMAISAYHKYEDLKQIPQFIYDLDSTYKFYLRRHSHLVHELVLYAV